ncbi:acetolactate synthase-1/2/3 large subunit [Desulfuromusa kysingii]|uniref:Acetolactate synthase-1/2/3 large subunit n=1 Tax=Desulfuromusa kysingii TaxID=37625 RepID=A0A1H3YKW9_9BACT|nr:thiamine pyrophosphate-binding protein [Desulfuromusa kysingii]SEA11618.1 acetolactate synthase-1/2/3 large subunit [Desulfuromusa kysingii]
MSQINDSRRLYLDQKNDLADLVIELLEELQIDVVFGIPGGSIEPLFDAMARSSRRGGLRPVVARHETGAAFMAEGYHRETGKIGVCCSTTGPGATNLITGVSSAYVAQIPLLVITAQTALPLFGKLTLQESSCSSINTVEMFRCCTRYSSLISHRGQLEEKFIAAFTAMKGTPSGPVHLSIPTDILTAPRRMGSRRSLLKLETITQRPKTLDPEALSALLTEVKQAQQMVLLLGDGCGHGIQDIMTFAEKNNVRIVTGPAGKRWIDHCHPLYYGVVGYAGHASADEVLEDPGNDLVLAVGTRLGEMIFSGRRDDIQLNKKLIHIDNNPEHFSQSLLARLHVCGAVDKIFSALNQQLPDQRQDESCYTPSVRGENPNIVVDDCAAYVSSSTPIKPQRLMRELSLKVLADYRIFIDAGNSWAWATHYLHLSSSNRCHIEMGFGAMTWAIGNSVGSAVGAPGTPTLCITGDGSYLMSGQELTVAVAEKLPLVFVILNDSNLGMVMHGQRLGGGEPIAFELPPVDFAQVARSMGAEAETVRTIDELEALDFIAMGKRSGPTVVDVYIDPQEVPPMGARMKTLGRAEQNKVNVVETA